MPSATPASRARLRLLDVLPPVIQDLGYDLEDVTVTAVGRRSVVRVVVDSDAGVDLDAIADVSRGISEVLDGAADDVFPDPYVLEVSSPGIDRPLTEPRHWRRAKDRLVEVKVDGTPATARIVSTDTDGVLLAADTGQRHVAWSALGPGKVQIEFSRKGAASTDETDPDDPDTDPDDPDTDDIEEG